MSSAAQLDRRRANAPDSIPIVFDTALEEDASSSASTALPKRVGRTALEPRPIFLHTALIPQANGSAYFEAGGLKLACAVYGPRQVRGKTYSGKAELNVEVRFAPFAGEKRRRPGKDVESTSLSTSLRSALLSSIRLALLPKASLDVYVTVLESDAGALGGEDAGIVPAAATVASVALADAGVEMWGIVVGSSAIIPRTKGAPKLLLDPTRAEAALARAHAAVCLMPALGSVTALELGGDLSAEESDEIMAVLQKACNELHFVAARALQEGFEGAEQAAATAS